MRLHPQQYAKALVGALVAGLSVLAGAVGDGVSAEEWLTTAVAFLTGLGLVFAVPNKPAPGRRSDPALSEQGGINLDTVLTITVGIVLAVAILWVLNQAL